MKIKFYTDMGVEDIIVSKETSIIDLAEEQKVNLDLVGISVDGVPIKIKEFTKSLDELGAAEDSAVAVVTKTTNR